MEKVKLIEREELKVIEEARIALDNANEALDNANEALDNAKASNAKNKASLVGNAYIAFCEVLQDRDDKLVAYSEAIEKAKTTEKHFPRCDSKEEWKKQGFEEEYKAISTWYTCADSILEVMQTLRNINTVSKQDIINYFSCYKHQLTNANDMVKFGTISATSDKIVHNASNYAFKDKFARASDEAEQAREKTIEQFTEVLNLLLDSFIE